MSHARSGLGIATRRPSERKQERVCTGRTHEAIISDARRANKSVAATTVPKQFPSGSRSSVDVPPLGRPTVSEARTGFVFLRAPPLSSSMHDDDLAIDIRRVTKRYEEHVAVRDLSLQVPKGAVYGLLGPNGAGKTTTIRMLLDIIAPDAGSIAIFGRPNNETGLLKIGRAHV